MSSGAPANEWPRLRQAAAAQVPAFPVEIDASWSRSTDGDAERQSEAGGGWRWRGNALIMAATRSPRLRGEPSLRPVKPSFSVVVALTLTRSGASPRISATRSTIRARCGEIRGRSPMIVTSTAAIWPPLSRTRSAAWRRNWSEAAPRQRGSLGGKCIPISPAPIAPSTASVIACNPTSASE